MAKRGAQKEAVFQIVKTVLATRYQDGMKANDVLNYEEKITIADRVMVGIKNGSIPHKGGVPHSRYGYLILNYWLRNDKRLNGGVRGASPISLGRLEHRYETLKQANILLQDLIKIRNHSELPEEKRIEADNHIWVLQLQTFIKASGINLLQLSDDVLKELGFDKAELKRSRTVIRKKAA